MKRTITMVAVEPKGGTTVDKEPFSTAHLPEGKGYALKPPDASGRWEVSTYRWDPSQIIVNEGDEVTLAILGVIGAEHPTVIDAYDISFTVKRGQLTTVTFTTDKPGVFEFRCGIHEPSIVGELIVLPGG
jgi:plastocyanin